jgi:hypothetical protein
MSQAPPGRSFCFRRGENDHAVGGAIVDDTIHSGGMDNRD